MGRVILIYGFTDSRKNLPLDNDNAEIWGLNDVWRMAKGSVEFDRVYELHSYQERFPSYHAGSGNPHEKWLKETDADIWCFYPDPDWKNPKLLPEEEIRQNKWFKPYVTNTVSWMIAHALHEGIGEGDELWLGGLDFAMPHELQLERASVEFFLGIAIGRGVDVHIAPGSFLLHSVAGLYGLEPSEHLRSIFYQMRNSMFERVQAYLAGGETNTALKSQGAMEAYEAMGDALAPKGF